LKARMLPSPDFTGETPGSISLLHTPVDATRDIGRSGNVTAWHSVPLTRGLQRYLYELYMSNAESIYRPLPKERYCMISPYPPNSLIFIAPTPNPQKQQSDASTPTSAPIPRKIASCCSAASRKTTAGKTTAARRSYQFVFACRSNTTKKESLQANATIYKQLIADYTSNDGPATASIRSTHSRPKQRLACSREPA
jgi:hypothetical protein